MQLTSSHLIDDDLNSHLRFSYVQGMNVLAAPFLYVMSELDAFYCFSSFITKMCPLYVQPALEGVHCALKLLDLCLKVVDPELFGYLRGKNLSAELYAFPGKSLKLVYKRYMRILLRIFFSRFDVLYVCSTVR